MDERPVLFCLEGQPIRKGDIVRVKSLGYGWILEGQVLPVLAVSLTWDTGSMLGQDEVYEEVEEVHGLVDSVMRAVRVEDLELISEEG